MPRPAGMAASVWCQGDKCPDGSSGQSGTRAPGRGSGSGASWRFFQAELVGEVPGGFFYLLGGLFEFLGCLPLEIA